MAQEKQTYANHTRWYPVWHFFAFPVTAIAALHLTWGAIRDPSTMHILYAIYGFAIAAAVFASRAMAMRVQDRLIRLEMRLRLKEIVPPALFARFGELSLRQIVGLRFAGDAEMAGLMERVLKGELTEEKAIKQAVKDWQGDYIRA
ncbi:MAG: DUF6526 family protein [Gemmatimonadota bacterium]|nr:DUF6526 family protein [Gemmatimonadota bacterium]